MRLFPQTLSAAGDSPWMIPPPLPKNSTIGLALTFTTNANLTAAVQYTYDDPAQTPVPVTLARAGTVLTVNLVNHGLNVNDTTDLLEGALGTWNGNYDVASVPNQNSFTVTVPNAGAAADTAQARIYKLFTHATVTGTGAPPARIDGEFTYQIAAFRLHVSAYTAGAATLTAQVGGGV